MARAPRFIALGATCALFAGCPKLSTSGDTTNTAGSGSAHCSPLDGTYRFSYKKISGNCPPQPDELVEFRDGQSVSSPAQRCEAGGEEMSNSCTLRRQSQCNVTDPLTGTLLGVAQVSGSLTEVDDNTTIQGTFDVALSDTSGAACMGTYDVTGSLQ